jgi:hypothetical protein
MAWKKKQLVFVKLMVDKIFLTANIVNITNTNTGYLDTKMFTSSSLLRSLSLRSLLRRSSM